MASALPTDAQRIVSLSIGKIASSRSQRGGINLHKNLLVASVLHKARTSYMMENYHSLLAAKKIQNTEQQQDILKEQDARDEPMKNSTQNAVTHIRHESRMESGSHGEEDFSVSPLNENNKENSRPVCFSENQAVVSRDQVSNALCEKKIDNNNSQIESDTMNHRQEKGVADYVTMCQKCTVKRRRSFDQENDSSFPKKAKLSNDSGNMDMQVECCQVNNLVSIFNSGMSEVCTNLTDSNRGDYVSLDSENRNRLANRVSVQTAFSSQNRKTSLDSYSCSVQVKDNSYENLPTVIALTV
ncbi:hypothetical protein SNE40_001633 [Patella caerulea]|uniref:Uncharacterized protein n=1 Tax=Patella caerulea TaxID=87958 RepID=A0AAN8KGC5_PATCE